jgi:5-methylcytosine-specific restriction endonuclease McrA
MKKKMPCMRRYVPIERLMDMCARSQVRDVEKRCEICSELFFAPRHRASVAKYCGRPCYYKSMAKRGGVVLNCDICGQEYRRAPSHSHYITKTCSYKCRGIATRAPLPVSKDVPSVKLWLKRRGLIKACSVCGYDDHSEILIVHHHDRDRTNNNLDNLIVLCPNCHSLEHLNEHRQGWSHASTKRNKPIRNTEKYSRNVGDTS